MERFHTHEDEFSYDLLKEYHIQLMVESVNALDEAEKSIEGNSRQMSDGRTVWIARWDDSDDIHYRLVAITYVSKETALESTEEQKLRTDYYLTRESSLPHITDERYYFTNVRRVVQLCDESRRGVPNESSEEDFHMMKVVLGYLRERPGRQEPSEALQKMAIEYALEAQEGRRLILRSLIQRVGFVDHKEPKAALLEKAIKYLMQLNVVIGESVARSYIQDEISRHGQLSLPAGESNL